MSQFYLQFNGQQLLFKPHKMKFSTNDFFCKCGQICGFLRIWSHLLKKSLLENFIFCAVYCKNGLTSWQKILTNALKTFYDL